MFWRGFHTGDGHIALTAGGLLYEQGRRFVAFRGCFVARGSFVARGCFVWKNARGFERILVWGSRGFCQLLISVDSNMAVTYNR